MMTRMANVTPAALLDEARQRVGEDIRRGATATSALSHLRVTWITSCGGSRP